MSFEYSATSMDAIHFVKSSLYSNDIVCPKYGRSLFLSTLFSLLINVRLKWNGACRFGSQPKYHQMSSIGHESISLRLELFPSATLEHTSLALLEILKENYKESLRQKILFIYNSFVQVYIVFIAYLILNWCFLNPDSCFFLLFPPKRASPNTESGGMANGKASS